MAPSVAFEGLLSVMMIVSLPSSAASSTMLSVMVLLVSPALKVTVPLASVKSVPPPVAVPPVTA